MNKRIWATLDDYLPPSSSHKMMGKGFANYHFLEALLKYGHFDEYHFFLINRSHKKAFETAHQALFQAADVESKVKVFYRSQLSDAVDQYDYTVFHQSDHIVHFNTLCHFRNQVGAFPVTAFIHSISYPGMMSGLQEMAFGGVTYGDAIICSSDAGKRVLENWFDQIHQLRQIPPPPVRMAVIPFGFDSTAFDGLDKKTARKRVGITPDARIGLCFGRFSEYDKMDLFPLLQAFHGIFQRAHPWRLVLAGAAHHPEYVKMVDLWIKALGLQDAVIWKTDISDADKTALFKAADFFISPSDNLQETFGLTLLEAMAAGLPLIVSDFSGYREIATPDIAERVPTRWGDLDLFNRTAFGSLSDEAALHRYMAQSVIVDVDCLAGSIADFFSNPKRCTEMGASARKRFEAHYHYPRIIERLEGCWSNLKDNFSPEVTRQDRGPLFPDYFQSFCHYFTGHVGLHDVVRRTDFARMLLEAGQDYPLLPGMDQVVNRQQVRHIAAYTAESKTIGEIVDEMGSLNGRTRYQVMWMLKHGLLRLVKEKTDAHSFI